MAAVVCAVDAETIMDKVRDKYVGNLVRRQLTAADTLILNKIDLLDNRAAERLQAWLAEQVPESRIVTASFGDVDTAVLLGGRHRALADGAPRHAHAPRINSHVWTPPGPVDLDALTTVLHTLPAGIERLKGFVVDAETDTRRLVQSTGRRHEITVASADDDAPCQVVLIGTCSSNTLAAIVADLDRSARLPGSGGR